jgi:hypothetical protein
MREVSAEFVARAPDRIIPWETSFGTELTISHRASTESLNIGRAQLKLEIPAHGATMMTAGGKR